MDEKRTIRVMAVDDHELLTSGIHYVLLSFDDLQLVAIASTTKRLSTRSGILEYLNMAHLLSKTESLSFRVYCF